MWGQPGSPRAPELAPGVAPPLHGAGMAPWPLPARRQPAARFQEGEPWQLKGTNR